MFKPGPFTEGDEKMNCIEITPSMLGGEITIPPSKSLCHRAIICASLSKGESTIQNFTMSEDMRATIGGMEALGAKIEKKQNVNTLTLKINGGFNRIRNEIDCIESGSTLRFLIPIALLDGGKTTFTGRGKLVSRPIEPYLDIFNSQNIKYMLQNGQLPLGVEGALKSGEYRVKGNISSQFITGLMFALPLLNGDSRIIVTTELESKGYIDLTLDVLWKYGIEIENKDYKEFYIKGNQKYIGRDYYVEGDFSQAAFWIVAGLLGNGIICKGLNPSSLQGDRAILDIVREMGGHFEQKGDIIHVHGSRTLGGVIDASQCPDLVPILAVLGALSSGTTKIINAARVRIKESDRLKAISQELIKLGAHIEELEDGLIIKGREQLNGGEVDSWNDHRIAMALAVASIKSREPVIITNSSAVKKSYPGFWDDFKSLGGKVNEWSLG